MKDFQLARGDVDIEYGPWTQVKGTGIRSRPARGDDQREDAHVQHPDQELLRTGVRQGDQGPAHDGPVAGRACDRARDEPGRDTLRRPFPRPGEVGRRVVGGSRRGRRRGRRRRTAAELQAEHPRRGRDAQAVHVRVADSEEGGGDVRRRGRGVVRDGEGGPEGDRGAEAAAEESKRRARVVGGAAARPSLRPARGEDPEAASVRAAREAQAEVRRDGRADGRRGHREARWDRDSPGDYVVVRSFRRPHIVRPRPGGGRGQAAQVEGEEGAHGETAEPGSAEEVQLLVLELSRALLACLLVLLAMGPLAVHATVLDEAAGRAALELDGVAPLLAAVGAGFAAIVHNRHAAHCRLLCRRNPSAVADTPSVPAQPSAWLDAKPAPRRRIGRELTNHCPLKQPEPQSGQSRGAAPMGISPPPVRSLFGGGADFHACASAAAEDGSA
ncbi:hypothetical protein THAOC_08593, partial [Thalassiosira oceanica]